MLELFAKHGGFDLELRARGDLDVDQHHTVEDVGIVLGQCFRQALGDRRGINRAGYFLMPLDEALAVAAVDLSGRPYLVWNARFPQAQGGGSADGAGGGFLSGLCHPRRGQRALEASLRPLHAPRRGGHLQDLRARHENGRFAGCPAEKGTAQHEGVAVISVIDYGAGNLRSVENALQYLQVPYAITSEAGEVATGSAILLPGVGHFGQMMRSLERLGLDPGAAGGDRQRSAVPGNLPGDARIV